MSEEITHWLRFDVLGPGTPLVATLGMNHPTSIKAITQSQTLTHCGLQKLNRWLCKSVDVNTGVLDIGIGPRGAVQDASFVWQTCALCAQNSFIR